MLHLSLFAKLRQVFRGDDVFGINKIVASALSCLLQLALLACLSNTHILSTEACTNILFLTKWEAFLMGSSE